MSDRAVDEAFVRAFGAPPDADAQAPGRVNLIGEHTDYHHGFVLPTVLPQRTHVWLRRGERSRVRAFSATLRGDAALYTLGDEEPGKGWIDYVQGVTHVLRGHGIEVEGFDAWIVSTIPVGGGVSSSAALCVSLLRGLRALQGLSIDDHAIARLAQRVETDFVGAPVGIMDQMACSLGRPGEALFVDTRAIAFERIPWPTAAELVVIDSGVSHQHAGGEYVERRRESLGCESRRFGTPSPSRSLSARLRIPSPSRSRSTRLGIPSRSESRLRQRLWPSPRWMKTGPRSTR